MIPDKYTFSKRFKSLLDKAAELGYTDCYKHYKMPDGSETIECHYDVEMDSLFGDGMMPGAFEGVDDPMGDYLELQLTGFIWDLAYYLVNTGKLPLDTKGITECPEVEGRKIITIDPKCLGFVLATIMNI
jgi:hypothetical protein